MSETTLAIILCVTPTLALVTLGLVRELRLQAMARRGWLQTYAITGRPADLTAQKRDLENRHAMAATIHTKSPIRNVTRLPRRNPR